MPDFSGRTTTSPSRRWAAPLAAAILFASVLNAPALAAKCGKGPDGFGAWLGDFKTEAVKAGISQKTATAALAGVTYDARVIKLDRNQKVFKQSYEVFYRNRVTAGRMRKARAMLKAHDGLLRKIERLYGVPGAVVVAIWALETDFGANRGSMSTLRSLATLAYDCRRTDLFTEQLVYALRIIDRGDLSHAQMKGGWAGEIGQTQFMAKSYAQFAVDFDGNGRSDLIRSPADALASTANYLKAYGWQPNEGWTPGSANFAAIQGWNKSSVYARTIASFAAKLAGR